MVFVVLIITFLSFLFFFFSFFGWRKKISLNWEFVLEGDFVSIFFRKFEHFFTNLFRNFGPPKFAHRVSICANIEVSVNFWNKLKCEQHLLLFYLCNLFELFINFCNGNVLVFKRTHGKSAIKKRLKRAFKILLYFFELWTLKITLNCI